VLDTSCVPCAACCTLLEIRALLLNRGSDGGGDFTDAADRRADTLDRRDRFGGRGLNGADLTGDILGRFRRLIGQTVHFRSDNREALAGLPGARRLNGCVKRQQVYLPGDIADEVDHFADIFGWPRTGF